MANAHLVFWTVNGDLWQPSLSAVNNFEEWHCCIFLIGTRLPAFVEYVPKDAPSLLNITQTCKLLTLLAVPCAQKLELWQNMWHEMGLEWSVFTHIDDSMCSCFHVTCQISCSSACLWHLLEDLKVLALEPNQVVSDLRLCVFCLQVLHFVVLKLCEFVKLELRKKSLSTYLLENRDQTQQFKTTDLSCSVHAQTTPQT